MKHANLVFGSNFMCAEHWPGYTCYPSPSHHKHIHSLYTYVMFKYVSQTLLPGRMLRTNGTCAWRLSSSTCSQREARALVFRFDVTTREWLAECRARFCTYHASSSIYRMTCGVKCDPIEGVVARGTGPHVVRTLDACVAWARLVCCGCPPLRVALVWALCRGASCRGWMRGMFIEMWR